MNYTTRHLQYTTDWVTGMMLFVIKLQSFAWNYYDGQFPPQKQFPEKNRITKLPSIFAYFSWLFFFPGFFTGPVGEFNDYLALSNRSLFEPVCETTVF
jgi:hypothetical protein